jgi:hypothetical protein
MYFCVLLFEIKHAASRSIAPEQSGEESPDSTKRRTT